MILKCNSCNELVERKILKKVVRCLKCQNKLSHKKRASTEKRKLYLRTYQKNNRIKFSETLKKARLKYRQTDKHKQNNKVREAERRAKILKAMPSWISNEEKFKIKQFYKNCPKGFEVDHIIPLKGKIICGLHILSNLQYLTKSENARKRNNFS